MSTELSHERDSDGEVTIGENQKISLKSLQNIYHELTGKTENISRSLRKHTLAELSDFIQLNEKVLQILDQYNVVSTNCTVNIYYVNDTKTQYSSFDRFKLFDSSSMSTVENIRIEYNILILLPSLQKPQSYTIEINLHSRVALHSRAHSDLNFPSRILINIANNTGFVKIDYVDYTVARSFLIAVEHWYDALPKSKSIPGINFVKENSEHIPFLFKYSAAIFFSVYFYILIQKMDPENLTSLTDALGYGLIIFSTIFILSGLADKLGRVTEYAIDSFQPLSYVKLTRGDEVSIEKFNRSNLVSLVTAISGIIFTIGMGVLITWISKFLGILQ